jgi:hypothetical protein
MQIFPCPFPASWAFYRDRGMIDMKRDAIFAVAAYAAALSILSLVAVPARGDELDWPSPLKQTARWSVLLYQDCLAKAARTLARISREPASITVKAAIGKCSWRRDNAANGLEGGFLTEFGLPSDIDDFDKSIEDRMITFVIETRAGSKTPAIPYVILPDEQDCTGVLRTQRALDLCW